MIEAGEPNTEVVVAVSSVSCARPTGGSHGLTTHDPAQRCKGAKRRPCWTAYSKPSLEIALISVTVATLISS
jgi:hypothetical protein